MEERELDCAWAIRRRNEPRQGSELWQLLTACLCRQFQSDIRRLRAGSYILPLLKKRKPLPGLAGVLYQVFQYCWTFSMAAS